MGPKVCSPQQAPEAVWVRSSRYLRSWLAPSVSAPLVSTKNQLVELALMRILPRVLACRCPSCMKTQTTA